MQYGMLRFVHEEVDTSRKILHVDMDAFFANVEIRDQPALRNKPVCIAKHPNLTGGRGIVSTCNYEARKYGIHSAMSSQEAYKRCRHAIFIPGRHAYYRSISRKIHRIFQRYTDVIQAVSIDEAYLDVTENKFNIKSATLLAKKLQAEIYEATSLTCSIGVSYNKYIAKLASDYHKPNGITLVEPEDALAFLTQLPIEDFRGVGEKSVAKFHYLGIHTGLDLYQKSMDFLIEHFGKAGYSLYYNVRGRNNSPVKTTRERKSLGKETTFHQFLTMDREVKEQLQALTDKVSSYLQEKNLKAATITIKIRYDDFETLTRQVQMTQASNDSAYLFAYVEELWEQHGHLEKAIRLLGVSTSNFDDLLYEPIPFEL